MRKPYKDLQEFASDLERAGELVRIKEEVDPHLEASEIFLRHAKAEDGGKAILFEKVRGSSIPVLMNAFGSYKRLQIAFRDIPFESFQQEIKELADLNVPQGLMPMVKKAWDMKKVLSYPPSSYRGSAPCQEIVQKGEEVDLSSLPVLTSWPEDGGPFITLPLVFTKSLDGKMHNMGLYRMQVYDRNTTGMHWQIHKDGSHFHGQYRKASKRMPVAVAIGADPISVYCGTAPLPPGLFELIFAGFLRSESVPMVQCKTVDLRVPAHSEIILEGYVEADELRDEGPFGDHTGYYTPVEPYPVFHVTAITRKKNPLYLATVVGRSPMEDCYLAHATERLFLPLLQQIAPEVVDQHLPWDGNFHNCQVFQIEKEYPYQGRRLMSHIWGFSQASFCKCLITASTDAPIHDDEAFLNYFLDNLDVRKHLFITEGIVDALDHSASNKLYGGKVGFDISHPIEGEPGYGEKRGREEIRFPEFLDKELAMMDATITGCISFGQKLRNPVLLIRVNKSSNPGVGQRVSEKIFDRVNLKAFKLFVLVDEKNKDMSDGHKIMWRIFNNTDAKRDFYVSEDRLLIDATYKLRGEGFDREWPPDMEMDAEIIKQVDERFSKEKLGL